MSSVYLIHDNGGRPFRVSIDKNHVSVRKITKSYQGYEQKNIWEADFDRVWIGKSPKNSVTSFGGGYGPEFDGNSILVKLKTPEKKYDYVHIAAQIIGFHPQAPIVGFSSPVGNNDVPYPWAIDQKGNTYLLSEDVYIQAEAKKDIKKDPYGWYYKSSEIDKAGFENISSWSINGESYMLTNTPVEKTIVSAGDKMVLTYRDGSRKKITIDQLAALKTRFNKMLGVEHLSTIIIVPRLM